MTVDELIQRLMSVPGDMRVLVCGHELYEMILNMGDFKVYPPELSTCTVVGGDNIHRKRDLGAIDIHPNGTWTEVK